MNYNKLKYFYEISKILNLSHASEILFVSQSSLSKAISDLEKEFETPLFIRTNRNLILTPAGAELQKQLEPLFSKEQDIYVSVRNANLNNPEIIAAKLRIGFLTFQLSMHLPDFIRSFSKTYSSIEVLQYRLNKNELLKKLKKQTLDLALIIFSMDELSPQYSYKILSEHHLSIIMRRDHPFAGRTSVSLAELKNEDFIMHGHAKTSNEYGNAITWFQRNGFYPHIVAEFDYVETVLMMVQAGMGISILSDAAPIQDLPGLVSVPLDNAPILYGGFFWNKESKSDAVTLFIRAFCEYLQK